jgi:hypothetical protein
MGRPVVDRGDGDEFLDVSGGQGDHRGEVNCVHDLIKLDSACMRGEGRSDAPEVNRGDVNGDAAHTGLGKFNAIPKWDSALAEGVGEAHEGK